MTALLFALRIFFLVYNFKESWDMLWRMCGICAHFIVSQLPRFGTLRAANRNITTRVIDKVYYVKDISLYARI